MDNIKNTECKCCESDANYAGEQYQNYEENLGEVLSNFTPPFIEIEPYNITDAEFDENAFKAGVKSVSYLCGQATALFNANLSEDFVLNYVLTQLNIKQNIKLTKLNNRAQIEIAKQQKIVIEKELDKDSLAI